VGLANRNKKRIWFLHVRLSHGSTERLVTRTILHSP